jgi:RNA polymerase sigma-70 factor, ECF subfamily
MSTTEQVTLRGAEQEQVWVERAKQGDKIAFAQLVGAYQAPVYNLAYRMLGNGAEAEDAAQEVFLRVYTRLQTYDNCRKFSSWILSIGSHYCIDVLRRRRHQALSLEEDTLYEQLPDFGPRPEQQTLTREKSDEVRRIVDSLPTEYRLVIVLRYWYNLSYEEIAKTVHSTESAIKSRLHRARELMAVKVKEEQGRIAGRTGGERRAGVRWATNAGLGALSVGHSI